MSTSNMERMLGYDPEQLMQQVDHRLSRGEELAMIVASMLSDAQELIRMRDQTRSIQAINRAKWLLFEKLSTS